MDFRSILLVVGILLMAMATSMGVVSLVDAAAGSPDKWVFAASAGITMFAGVGLVLVNRTPGSDLTVRQAFVMITLSWVTLTLFGSLPFIFGEVGMSFTDAFFEAMSGITTTGSTVITGLDQLPPGLLLWRAVMQWLGGLGIIVMAIGILPMLRVGGMQLFKIEGFDAGEKALPRAAQISVGVTLVFVALTAVWAIALWLAGMSGIEAVVHAMTTIATGGYSTSDQSVGHFDSALIEAIISGGMIVGGLPFTLILLFLRGRFSGLLRDSQVHWYLGILFLATVAIGGWLWFSLHMEPLRALRYATFTVTSIMTGTGYVSTDYSLWGEFPVALLLFLTFVGGCAGSTSCGIKIFRFQVICAVARSQIRHLVHPHGIFVLYYNKRPISDEVATSVLSFFFIFGFCFIALTLGLSLLGLDLVTAISSAATALANVGPGLGSIVGPADTFQTLPDAAKWLLALGMLTGRLEVMTVMVLFSRSFWRG